MKILAMASAVPAAKVIVAEQTDRFSEDTIKKIVRNTGVKEFRYAPEELCTSDLCLQAAEKIIAATGIDRAEIQAVIFVSQTPDYLSPATSPIIQAKLGLPDTTFTMDMNQGCTGFTDGLIVANSLMKGMGLKNVLLLTGDTISKMTNQQDQGCALLFGDAGNATLLQADDSELAFSAGTDGLGEDFIKQNLGYRTGLKPGTTISWDSLGTKLNGAEVFNFTIKRVPPMVANVLEKANWQIDDVDYFVFHQANLFIMNYLIRKMKLPKEKCPVGITKFGNTSSASIPLTIATEIGEEFSHNKKAIFVGFGIGMAWSAVAVQTENTIVCPLIEVK